MTVKQILTPIINQEFAKYERNGYKIKLKSVTNNRIMYTIFCALGAVLCWPIALVVYIVLMSKTNNIDTIISLAKKSPDKPIEQIVAEEIKR